MGVVENNSHIQNPESFDILNFKDNMTKQLSKDVFLIGGYVIINIMMLPLITNNGCKGEQQKITNFDRNHVKAMFS